MALGSGYDNNKKNQGVNVYSPYRMSNIEGIDPSMLNFTFCLNMLKIGISPKKPGDQIAFDHEKAIECFVTHTKAKMLSNEIKYMMSHKGEIHNVSITTGKDGLVEFSDGIELGNNKYTLILRKIDENGKPVSSYAYEFKNDYHFTMRNYDPDSPAKFDRVIHDMIEVDEFIALLDSYYESMTGATAYSVLENAKYSQSRINTKLDSIMDKLGIEIPRSANYSKPNNNSFFNNSGNTTNTYRQGSLDDFSSSMNTPEDVEE